MSKQFLLRRFSTTFIVQVKRFSSFFPSLLSSYSSSSLSSSSSVLSKLSIISQSILKTYQPARLIHSSSLVSAGHNRWSKIHRKKAVADHERSRVIAKYRQRIISAIQIAGGPDPEVNPRLASLMSQAKAVGMSKTQIETLLKPDLSKQAPKEHLVYEARAQVGYLILIEVLTDNKKRVRSELKIFLTRKGCTMGDSGSSLFNFDHKGIIRVPYNELLASNTDPYELAIEVGAEEVTTDSSSSNPQETATSHDETSKLDSERRTDESKDDECYQFICEPRDLTLVSNAVKDKSFTVVSASLEYIPKRLVKLSHKDFENAEKLMKMLGEREEVMEVHDNFVLDEQDDE